MRERLPAGCLELWEGDFFSTLPGLTKASPGKEAAKRHMRLRHVEKVNVSGGYVRSALLLKSPRW